MLRANQQSSDRTGGLKGAKSKACRALQGLADKLRGYLSSTAFSQGSETTGSRQG